MVYSSCKCGKVSLTSRHFGISPKTFYKWQNRYNPHNLWTLEDKSKEPIHKRQREITSLEEMRIVALRKQYIKYSKIKLAKIYEQDYNEPVSSWTLQDEFINLGNFTPNPTVFNQNLTDLSEPDKSV